MSDETDLIKLYSARILGLAADIPHLGRLENPDASVTRRSPLCGSTVTVDVVVEDGKLAQMGGEEAERVLLLAQALEKERQPHAVVELREEARA